MRTRDPKLYICLGILVYTCESFRELSGGDRSIRKMECKWKHLEGGIKTTLTVERRVQGFCAVVTRSLTLC